MESVKRYESRASKDWGCPVSDLLWALQVLTPAGPGVKHSTHLGTHTSLSAAVEAACLAGDAEYNLFCARRVDFPAGDIKNCVVRLPNPGGLRLVVRGGRPAAPTHFFGEPIDDSLRAQIERANGLPVAETWIY